ncbi:hypothetical protein [Methylomonas methanica]|uniref:GIY-YIG domain-containing protein n=1 Tax=Methylomonas methanica TaxID=421 RepID=A0A177MK75_METMH|nr:hypothetical protein [Methylomonas methanica]OAI06196.1 hypothetical protein A1332_01435 [Methylomonas methanica]
MATRDILDFLAPEYTSFNSTSDKMYLKIATRGISITPRWWKEYSVYLNKLKFDWKEVKYTELANALDRNPSLASKTGVYIFVIKPDLQIASLPAYVFYVGIAGESGSGRPLRERLKQYIQISGIKKRPKVVTALEYYYDVTTIFFSEFDDTSNLEEIEEWLHAFYMPWANERDFPVKIKEARKCYT